NPPLGFVDHFNLHVTKESWKGPHWTLDFGLWTFPKPACGPFDDRHSIWTEIILETRGHDLLRGFVAIEIDVKQSHSAARINPHERERRRVNPVRDAETARQSFHKLRLAGAEIAGETDHQARLRRAAPRFPERFGFGRAMRNVRSHES